MNKKKQGKLSREILGLFGVSALVSIFFYGFIYSMSTSIAWNYCEDNVIVPTEMQTYAMNIWIRGVSLAAAVFLFIVLFLVLLGQKLGYLREIIQGIHALREEGMNYVIPTKENNELTELAESINYLSDTERKLKEKEARMQEEREQFIRSISHDIRTPLTTMISYTELMQQKEELTQEEMKQYVELMRKKGYQIKELTDCMLGQGLRNLERIENGRLFMEQLVEEWEEVLEDNFTCVVDMENCPDFSGAFDIQELRRIFDNLASNIEKYADREQPIELSVSVEDSSLVVCQKNGYRKDTKEVESHKIGLKSIRRIVKNYGGDVVVEPSSEFFRITFHIPL